MKLLASFKVENVTDIVNSIGSENYTNTTVQQLVDNLDNPYAIYAYGGNLYVCFGLEENATLTATLTDGGNNQYTSDAENWVIEYPDKTTSVLFGGHPIHRPK